MKRESLLNLRTSREILTSLDVARLKRSSPTMLQRMRRIIQGTEEITPHINEAVIAIELHKERRRFARRLEAVERGTAKILGFRRKLAGTMEKNRQLFNLRIQLQRQYWDSTSRFQPRAPQALLATAVEEQTTPRFKVKRLRYGGKS